MTHSDSGGYWLIGADGGVFSFGDAGYHGGLGGIFTFGAATFEGAASA